MPWELFANDAVNHPGDVTSYQHLESVLVDPHRRMHIVSGIAVPAFVTNDDEKIYRGVCTVHLGVSMVNLEQATCQVGLAVVWNGKSAFVFAIDDSWVDLDEAGGLRLFAALGLNGEGSSLARFGFQVVAVGANATTSVAGHVRWARSVNDRTNRTGEEVRRTYVVEAVRVETVAATVEDIFAFDRLTPLGLTASPTGAIHQDGDDFVVPYTIDNLPLGVPMRLLVHPSTEFGDVVTPQISGPVPVLLTPGHLQEADVNFRIIHRIALA